MASIESSYESMSNHNLDTATETNILARIARGDTYEAIRRDLAVEGTSIAISTISAVKKRNVASLEFMQNELVKHETNQSTKLLTKSRKLLERKLDKALGIDEQIEDITEQYQAGEIDDVMFRSLTDRADKSELTASELNSITKEMFNQSQVEQGKPTAITDNPTQAKENLKTLLEAINDKDDRKIIEAIFPDA